FTLSFTSIVLGLLVSTDPLSTWFQRYVEETGVSIDSILKHGNLDRDRLAAVRSSPPSPDEDPGRPLRHPTTSAGRIIETAYRLADQVSSPSAPPVEQQSATPNAPLDVRHVMGALV